MLVYFQLLHIALIAFSILMLGRMAYAKQLAKQENQYLIYLIIAFGLWIAMDIQRLIFYNFSDLSDERLFQKSLFINIFSAWNNAFLLAALPLFVVSSKINLLKSDNWVKYLFGANLIITIGYIFLWSLENQWGSQVIRGFNEIYSTATLFFLGAIYFKNLRDQTVFGKVASTLWVSFLLLLFLLPYGYRLYTGEFSVGTHYTSIYSVHIIIAFTALLLVYNKQRTKESMDLLSEANSLKEKLLHAEATIKSLRESGLDGGFNLNELKRHLTFYKKNDEYVIELTMLDMDITQLRIQKPQLTREYKDLLRFAVNKKAGLLIKSYGGMLKGFGEISKAILDIRKRLINPVLIENGYDELKHNELIVQRIKGSGVYELECIADHIVIQVVQLSKNHELAKILEPLSVLEISTKIS